MAVVSHHISPARVYHRAVTVSEFWNTPMAWEARALRLFKILTMVMCYRVTTFQHVSFTLTNKKYDWGGQGGGVTLERTEGYLGRVEAAPK